MANLGPSSISRTHVGIVSAAVAGVAILAVAPAVVRLSLLLTLGALVTVVALRGRADGRGAESAVRVERLAACALGPGQSVHVVRVGERVLVLGATASNIALLSVEDAPVDVTADEPNPRAIRPGRRALAALCLAGALAVAAPVSAAQHESPNQIAIEPAEPSAKPSAELTPVPSAPPIPTGIAEPAKWTAPALPPGSGASPILWLAGLAIVPFMLMTTTSFVKITVVLSLLRSAIGAQQTPSDPVIAAIALALTLFVMAPVARDITSRLEATPPDTSSFGGALAAVQSAAEPARSFLERNARPEEVALFVELSAHEGAERAEASSFAVLVPAFVTSELREAFVVGFVIFVPFLVVDMVVANILMAMGMVMVSPASVALPFKVMLFVLIDGWPMVMKGLALSYR